MRLDILFVADVRFEGGTSTALAVEIRAAARAGLKTGLLAVKGPLLGHPFPMHPDLRALIDGGATERIDPDMKIEVDLVLLHHPTIMSNRITRPLGFEAKRLVLVLHHPMVDRLGKVQYDLGRVVSNCNSAFWLPVLLAPVSAVVRDSLPRRLPEGSELLAENWDNLIDLDDWPLRPERPPATPIVIGRHARPDKQKWPSRAADALRAYPADGSRYSIRMLGGDTFLQEAYGPLPANWELLPFAWTGVAEFLQGLDFYVYYHSDSWSEAFGRTILEALAVGLVTILPPHFQPLFGDAAIYAAPRDVEQVIAKFVADPEAFAAQSARARAFVVEHHAADLFPQRIARLFGIPKPPDPAIRTRFDDRAAADAFGPVCLDQRHRGRASDAADGRGAAAAGRAEAGLRDDVLRHEGRSRRRLSHAFPDLSSQYRCRAGRLERCARRRAVRPDQPSAPGGIRL